jgi:hypothetical protein
MRRIWASSYRTSPVIVTPGNDPGRPAAEAVAEAMSNGAKAAVIGAGAS